MPEPRLLKVFLCHSSNDKPVVRELYQKLRVEGWIDPWLDEEKLLPGQDWDMEIEKAVRGTDSVVVCLSNNSVTKEGYVQHEMRLVLRIAGYKPEGTIFVIPIRLDDCPVPMRFELSHYVDLFPPERKDWAYSRLLAGLKKRAETLDIQIADPQPAQIQLKGNLVAKKIPEVVKDIKSEPSTDTRSFSDEAVSPKTGSREGSLVIGDMEFMLVSKGKFIMGSKEDDKDALDLEKPQHTIEMPYDYWLARFTVTNAQFEKFITATGYKTTAEQQGSAYAYTGQEWKDTKGANWQHPRGPQSGIVDRPDHPVVAVSWLDALEYIKWLNQSLGAPQSGLVYRLPTEAEWEKAARGVYGNIYPWGNEFDKTRCNSYESGKMDTLPVGAFPNGVSPYGCEQMSGNVWEWTHTLFQNYPYAFDEQRENETDRSSYRVLRGGAFSYTRQYVRSAYRLRDAPNDRFGSRGFRLSLAPISKL